MKSWPTNSNIELCLSPQRKNFEEHTSHPTTESSDLLICSLKFLQVVSWTSEKGTQAYKQLHTSDGLHLVYHSHCTVIISTTMLNPVRERAFIVWCGFAHSASLQKHCCFNSDWGTTIFRNWYSHAQEYFTCWSLPKWESESSWCYSCKNECSLLPHQHLSKAGNDALHASTRKLAKERWHTGGSYILSSSCFYLFCLKWRKSFPIFRYEPLFIFEGYNVNHSTCFPIISYHNSPVYWKVISSTEVKARINCPWVLIYWKLNRGL